MIGMHPLRGNETIFRDRIVRLSSRSRNGCVHLSGRDGLIIIRIIDGNEARQFGFVVPFAGVYVPI